MADEIRREWTIITDAEEAAIEEYEEANDV